MKYTGVLLAVTNMEVSKRFYKEMLGLEVIADFGANVELENKIFLQTVDTWKQFIRSEHVVLGNHAEELYFEEDDLDCFYKRLKEREIELVHPMIEHSWGQRGIRFFDPDHHIIEVSESLETVIKRFLAQGMTVEETAVRMDVPIDYINGVI